MSEEAFDFDGWSIPVYPDMIPARTALVTPDRGFERFGGSRLREDLLDIGQNNAPSLCGTASQAVRLNIVICGRKLKCL